ncbi:uncharacterized protein MAM_05365 [Metarhizium album ARSEF 1941]|uniref:Uncharacterized protein n=1 Tax=Metarhizium album (strain ARSEF 1941) TaxID=1081103 RepID=A0A0B2WT66_METAS|nr:uncharacterized protein MAM_05365 [Metarhizium album ARSEF 1941]KHN96809.1 hypothetical protein MAM_05365 [Metarhizium album ARSEF 1941]
MSLHFLDLPVDILSLILGPLLIQDQQPIALCPCGSPESGGGFGTNPLSVLLIHPAIYAIAAPLLYEGNEFVLDLRLEHGLHTRSYLDDRAEEDASDSRDGLRSTKTDDMAIHRRKEMLALQGALGRIRSLEMRISKLRGWIDVRIVPLVRDMIVSGGLAELTVKIYSSAGHAARGNSIFTRPPLAGVLSLLSDPYLRTACLWVSAAAGGAWEPFRTSTASAAAAAEGHGGGDGNDDGDGLVQIDWASIVKQLDPEGRQVAVLRDGGKANVARW